MKQINYTGSSKLIARIIDLLNKKAPLPLDQHGEVDWGTDGKVLATDGVGGTKWVTASSGGGDVTDVKVNGSSVVDANKVANVTVPTALSDLQDDSTHRVVTDTEKSTWSGKQDALTAGTNIQINGTTISATDTTYSDATQSTAGLMSTTDKTKLDGIANGAEVNVQSDWNEADSSSDAYIANKPTIPAAQIQSDWTQADNTQADYIKNKPTIPTVNDGTLTIQQNGTTVGTFSANQSGDTTVNLTGGGGSGGHTIENTSGADLPQEDNLQFVGVYTEDDSANDRTKVNIVRQMTKAAMEALSSAEKEGFIDTTDEDDDYIPISAEDVKYGNTDVESKLDALTTDVSGKVSKSGDTMTGNLTVDRKNGTASAEGYSYFTLGNDTPAGTNQNSTGLIRLYSETAYPAIVYANALTQIRYIGFPNRSGTLSMRTVTTLVNESVTIAVNATKTYSALTLSALQAYDELTFMFADGNVLFNGSLTKAQLNMIAGISSGKMYIFGGQVVSSGSVLLDYKCKVYADASGLSILNQSLSSSIDKVLIEGITY